MKLVAALRRALALVVESLVPSGQDSTDSESRDAAARWGQQGDGQDDLDAGFSGDSHYKCNSCFVDIPVSLPSFFYTMSVIFRHA